MKSTGYWDVTNMPNLYAEIPHEAARGLYILEFTTGEQYVGQATDVANRIAQHRRDTSHHKAWNDVQRVEFYHFPTGDLNEPEKQLIADRRNRFTLRNRTFNLGHDQASTLDSVIPREVQSTWVDDFEGLSLDKVAAAAERSIAVSPRLLTSPAASLYIDDLATIVELFIAAPTTTEAEFWSITDWPGTTSGEWRRAFTVNVGALELAYGLRDPLDDENQRRVYLNTEAGALISPGSRIRQQFTDARLRRRAKKAGHPYADTLVEQTSYRTTDVDTIAFQAGTLSQVLDGLRTPSQTVQDTRGLALNLMRQRRTPWASSHSRDLTTHVYQRIRERGPLPPPGEYSIFDS